MLVVALLALHQTTDLPTIIEFNAGNLLSVAQAYGANHSDRAIYIAGDEDQQRTAGLDEQGHHKLIPDG